MAAAYALDYLKAKTAAKVAGSSRETTNLLQ